MGQEITEEQINEFMQKMSKKSESTKTMVETSLDDLFNNFINIMNTLWSELQEQKKEIENLKKEDGEDNDS